MKLLLSFLFAFLSCVAFGKETVHSIEGQSNRMAADADLAWSQSGQVAAWGSANSNQSVRVHMWIEYSQKKELVPVVTLMVLGGDICHYSKQKDYSGEGYSVVEERKVLLFDGTPVSMNAKCHRGPYSLPNYLQMTPSRSLGVLHIVERFEKNETVMLGMIGQHYIEGIPVSAAGFSEVWDRYNRRPL